MNSGHLLTVSYEMIQVFEMINRGKACFINISSRYLFLYYGQYIACLGSEIHFHSITIDICECKVFRDAQFKEFYTNEKRSDTKLLALYQNHARTVIKTACASLKSSA